MLETKRINNLDEWCSILNDKFTYVFFSERNNHLIMNLPPANQDVSHNALTWLLDITDKWPHYILICFDDNIVRVGEVAIELYPGVKWSELFEQIEKVCKEQAAVRTEKRLARSSLSHIEN